jgi:hypothetical protein
MWILHHTILQTCKGTKMLVYNRFYCLWEDQWIQWALDVLYFVLWLCTCTWQYLSHLLLLQRSLLPGGIILQGVSLLQGSMSVFFCVPLWFGANWGYWPSDSDEESITRYSCFSLGWGLLLATGIGTRYKEHRFYISVRVAVIWIHHNSPISFRYQPTIIKESLWEAIVDDNLQLSRYRRRTLFSMHQRRRLRIRSGY